MIKPRTISMPGCCMCGALLLPLPCLAAPPTIEPKLAPAAEVESAGPIGADIDVEGPAPKPSSGLDVGGSVAVALGVATLVWGGVELSRGVVVQGGGRERRVLIDHRAAGNALIAVGATAFITGAVLLAFDWDQSTRTRKKRRAGPANFYPVFGTHGAGLAVAARF
ncbi:hypothetical protein ENSA5_48380 [Enhygromyxa salina]|uniref:Uncharacterized protein n=2 Tax=Enhygromyxa salina TaxID=215803 RepID=A0A2S9XIF3_9BACT|nr:hypothetical protein ENSA5_48380 [Enhygromyxa salina]